MVSDYYYFNFNILRRKIVFFLKFNIPILSQFFEKVKLSHGIWKQYVIVYVYDNNNMHTDPDSGSEFGIKKPAQTPVVASDEFTQRLIDFIGVYWWWNRGLYGSCVRAADLVIDRISFGCRGRALRISGWLKDGLLYDGRRVLVRLPYIRNGLNEMKKKINLRGYQQKNFQWKN